MSATYAEQWISNQYLGMEYIPQHFLRDFYG